MIPDTTRQVWTSREVAAFLIGGALRGEIAQRGDLELRRLSVGGTSRYLLTSLVDGSVTACGSTRAVIAAVASVLS